jgi:hypothetical protein
MSVTWKKPEIRRRKSIMTRRRPPARHFAIVCIPQRPSAESPISASRRFTRQLSDNVSCLHAFCCAISVVRFPSYSQNPTHAVFPCILVCVQPSSTIRFRMLFLFPLFMGAGRSNSGSCPSARLECCTRQKTQDVEATSAIS